MNNVRIGLHLLETLTSALYDNPIVLFREYVQNSVDAFNASPACEDIASRDKFLVKIDVYKEERRICIADNGPGIPNRKFLKTMRDIGNSEKANSRGQIGFRGIGRLSGMPFCEKLIFTNKAAGSKKIQTFTWSGLEFHNLLMQDDRHELEESIDKITTSSSEVYEGAEEDQFFKVELVNYGHEIQVLLEQLDFEHQLKMMLPLDYAPDFIFRDEIMKRYEDFMGRSLLFYSFKITLNGVLLYKPYGNQNALESGINFWEIRYKSKQAGSPGAKMGILWFTFNRKVEAVEKTQPYGVLVRSKNMLMGNHNALADAIFPSRGNDDYVSTYRELTQTLQGVYGELLLDTNDLKDNARRDWFKVDRASDELRNVCVAFLRLLLKYRKVASKTFSAIESDSSKEQLRTAYSELTANYDPKQFISAFYEQKRKQDKKKNDEKEDLTFAEEDIPRARIAYQRYYNQMLTIIRDFHIENKKPEDFVKLRAYIKKRISEELQK